MSSAAGVEVRAPAGAPGAAAGEVLTPAALDFVVGLHRTFNARREALLAARQERQARLDAGGTLDFLPETAEIRRGDWQVPEAPADLQRRWTEITGPVERRMIINALNSGADVYMADFEDALSPSWENVVQGQVNLRDAVRRAITFDTADGRHYQLNDRTATLLVRPRGWHLVEKHVLVDGQPISASLFDAGLYLFHNAREALARGTGPYFYLPKLESHREAALWNDVFTHAQSALGVPAGSVRVTVLIETLPAAFEMDEILHALRPHIAGLNAGRWDYIFSAIKRLRSRPDAVLPNRDQVRMTVPFMRAYTNLLVKTCHHRGAYAIGGMSAFIPSRRDAEVNERALGQVRQDKLRESGDGFDGTWVAHPDLVSVARTIFEQALGGKPHQRAKRRDDVTVRAADLTTLRVPDGTITEAGVRQNVSVAIRYLNAWLSGNGAAAIDNLMEDAATAEISRAQLWQWLRHRAPVDGAPFTAEAYRRIREQELARLTAGGAEHFATAAALLDELVLTQQFTEFLTVPAYRYIP